MTEPIRQTRFTTGEVDEIVWKRTDINEYLTAAQSLKNMEVGTTGLAKKRKGTEFMFDGSLYGNPNSRMYEFVDKNQKPYLLLSANKKFYVFDVPTDSVNVVTASKSQVITGRGSIVVARSRGMQFVQGIDTPYATTDLDQIDYAEDNDSLVLTHPDYPPARIYISDYTTVPPTFAYQVLDIYPLPSYDFNTINYNNFNVSLGVSGDTLTFQFTGVGADPGFNNDWVGGQILGGGTGDTDFSALGYAIITAVSYSSSGGGTVTFTGSVQLLFNTSSPATKGSQYSVRQPAWSTSLGYPAKVLFFQNRLWLANTKALSDGIFGSKINQPINFDVGTGRDTDAIIYSIGENDTGAIDWLNGGKQLEIFCEKAEFACPQDQNSALTPSTFSIRKQSSFGCSRLLKPVTYINDSYYASKTGKALINFHFNGVGLTYVATNISAASSHLVKSPNNRALLRGSDTSQDNFIYYLNPDDDTLTAFQFANEYKLAALTPVIFQDDVEIVAITTIDNEIFILKFYTLTDTYAIERFTEDEKIDCAQNFTMALDGTVTGLDMFNGYKVQVVYKDQDFGQYTVANGTIQIENPPGVSDTVTIGLLYDVELIPMYPYAGVAASPLKKNLTRIYVDYFESLNFTVNEKLVPYQTFAGIKASNGVLTPKTDTAIISPVSGWNRNISDVNDAVVIRQSSPFDLQILAIEYQIDVAVI